MTMPVTAVPMTMAPVMAVPVMAPPDFFRLQPIDVFLRDNRGFTARRHNGLFRCNRRQRPGLRARRKRGGACNKSNGEYQKVPAFHDIRPLLLVGDGGSLIATR